MANFRLPVALNKLVADLASRLHGRVRGRLFVLLVGVLFARGRQTVASWLRASAVRDEYREYYYFLESLGPRCQAVSARLMRLAVEKAGQDGKAGQRERLLFGLDDSPTKRYGKQVEGAGIHHNPTPGPAGEKFLYGHVWVTLSLLARHPEWAAVGLPLAAKLYIRQKQVAKLQKEGEAVSFRTKPELAAELLEAVHACAGDSGKEIWLAVDGGYANKVFLKAAKAKRMVVVSRLRKDAKLFDLPEKPKRGSTPKGRPRKYGKRISLAKRAAHPGGWQKGQFFLYGKEVTKTYKTFLATWKPAGGVIRVVLVKEQHGWVAFFSTKPEATVREILEAVADRSAIEQNFHDLKEVHGAGKQQVRKLARNLAAWHLNLWLASLIELWAWDQPQEDLCDRSASPWDSLNRRPSHQDKRNALRRACLQQEFSHAGLLPTNPHKMQRLVKRLLKLVA